MHFISMCFFYFILWHEKFLLYGIVPTFEKEQVGLKYGEKKIPTTY